MQLMIMNNLDPAVAQFPHELVTYGGNGSVFSNWLQYHLVMKYLSDLSETQTLVLNSGHPQGFVCKLLMPFLAVLAPLLAHLKLQHRSNACFALLQPLP